MADLGQFLGGGKPIKLAAQTTSSGSVMGKKVTLGGVDTTTYVDVINVSGKGLLVNLTLSDTADAEIIIDGVTYTRLGFSSTSIRRVIGVGASDDESWVLPPLVYDQSLRIRIRRSAAAGHPASASLYRVDLQ